MKILVIFTGGTIGSTKGEYIAPDGSKPYVLTARFLERTKEQVEFEYQTPYTILSENLDGVHVRQLCDCVAEALEGTCDGIIVTHGTDTLQYSAAALSYALGLTEIPIVLVSSNYVLEDERANGLDNFCAAVDFIRNREGRGVFVAYRNADGRVYMHRGSRVLPHLTYSDEVFSVMGQYYGFYENSAFVRNAEYRSVQENEDRIAVPKTEEYCVLRVPAHPQMRYPKLDGKIGAVLLESYHSGTICGESPELAEFLAEAERQSIPVFLIGATAGTAYESRKAWENSGIIVLPVSSNIAMYVKLWMLAAAGERTAEEISSKMKESVAQDILP